MTTRGEPPSTARRISAARFAEAGKRADTGSAALAGGTPTIGTTGQSAPAIRRRRRNGLPGNDVGWRGIGVEDMAMRRGERDLTVGLYISECAIIGEPVQRDNWADRSRT
jgi:hypothetical protein